MKRDYGTFIASIFFVLGFAVVFSVVGVLLQSVLSGVAYSVQKWLGRIGGAIIIFFGLYLLGLLRLSFLEREHKIDVKRKFKSKYAASFVFGAAFAVGWTPCVGAVLGAILTLAISSPGSAFILLLSYTLGLGIPFLLVGLFTNEAKQWIRKSGPWMKYVNMAFGVILIALGVLVFTDRLSLIANLAVPQTLLIFESGIDPSQGINMLIAFIAGLISFLSPCILPLIPAFLSYLAGIGNEQKS